MTGQQTPEREPVLLWHLTLGDQQKACQPGLGSQQVVAGRVPASLPHVIADGQQAAGGIVKEAEIHLGQVIAAPDQPVNLVNLPACLPTGTNQVLPAGLPAPLPGFRNQSGQLFTKSPELAVE